MDPRSGSFMRTVESKPAKATRAPAELPLEIRQMADAAASRSLAAAASGRAPASPGKQPLSDEKKGSPAPEGEDSAFAAAWDALIETAPRPGPKSDAAGDLIESAMADIQAKDPTSALDLAGPTVRARPELKRLPPALPPVEEDMLHAISVKRREPWLAIVLTVIVGLLLAVIAAVIILRTTDQRSAKPVISAPAQVETPAK